MSQVTHAALHNAAVRHHDVAILITPDYPCTAPEHHWNDYVQTLQASKVACIQSTPRTSSSCGTTGVLRAMLANFVGAASLAME